MLNLSEMYCVCQEEKSRLDPIAIEPIGCILALSMRQQSAILTAKAQTTICGFTSIAAHSTQCKGCDHKVSQLLDASISAKGTHPT